MPRLQILSKQEIINFDNPPNLDFVDRKKYFEPDKQISKIIKNFDISNKVGFILLYGYFLITKRFITADKFHYKDIKYVLNFLSVDEVDIDFDKYMRKGYQRHKKIIVELEGFTIYDDSDKNLIINGIDSNILNQSRPRQIFFNTITFLNLRKN
ncbi:DUF4158 domain-containing protein [Rickettsiales bacterium]|nr:DUF4158 domain-containing protein [Rickettsiales bacterium]